MNHPEIPHDIKTHKYAEVFRDFAAKIEKNDEKDFAGAFLIVAPSGEITDGILVGSKDIASFFGMVKTKLDTVIAQISDDEKKNQAFGRR